MNFFRLTALLLAVIMLSPVAASETASATVFEETDVYRQSVAGLEELAALARQGRSQVNTAAIETDAALDKLDYDVQSVVDFVKQQIAFEPYVGTLRGPRGTLLGRAGNALDQSLLLAKLLKDAGFDARIARAKLEPDQAKALLQEIPPDRSEAPIADDLGALAEVLSKISGGEISAAESERDLRAGPDPKKSSRYPEVVATTDLLAKQLDSAGVQLGAQNSPDTLLSEASDYFWVQYKDSAGGEWTDAHPSFAAQPPSGLPTASGYMADTVPPELTHRLRVQLFIERRSGSTLEAVPISEAWERPVANMVDIPLTVSNLPNSLSLEAAVQGQGAQSVDNAAYFIPLFNGSPAPGARFFTLQGTTVDSMAASDPAAGIFAEVAKGFSNMTTALGGAATALTAQWIELTLVAPGGEETVFRRTTFDRIGPAMRARSQVPEPFSATTPESAYPLIKQHTIMVAAIDMPRALGLDRAFENYIRSEPVYRELVEQAAYQALNVEGAPLPSSPAEPPRYWLGHLSQLALFDQADALSTTHRVYRAEPGLVIHSSGPDAGDGVSEMVDIVHNPRRALALTQELPVPDPNMNMMAGIWDTAVEGSLLREGDTRSDTAGLLSRAGGDWRVFSPGQQVDDPEIAQDVAAALTQDLSNGFAVITRLPQEDPEKAAWWRVHPVTGETVGQIRDGRGATLMERLTTEMPALEALSTYGFLMIGVGQCVQGLSACTASGMSCMASAVCCLTWNATGYALGLGLAGVVSIGWDMVAFYAPVCGP